MMEPYTEIKK